VNHLEATKTVVGTPCTSAAVTATLTLDTLGYDYASIEVIVDKSSTAGHTANSILNVLSLKQGDVSNSVTTDVYTVSVPAASVAVTNQASVVRLDVDCRGKGRYLKVDATPAVTLNTNIVARLGKGEKGADSAAEKGALAKYSG
jgi:hypothetical protein